MARDARAHRIGIGDVQIAVAERGDRLAVQHRDDVVAEHPACPGDQPAGHHTPTRAPRLVGCHQARFSTYHRTVAASPAAKSTRGA